MISLTDLAWRETVSHELMLFVVITWTMHRRPDSRDSHFSSVSRSANIMMDVRTGQTAPKEGAFEERFMQRIDKEWQVRHNC
jgi:hypothetical protein